MTLILQGAKLTVYRILFIFCCALAVQACSDRPKHLTFQPEDGEQRRYQMFSETYIEASNSFGSSSERIYSHMIMDYDVTEQAASFDVLMRPRFMMVRFRNGNFSSLDTPDYRQKKIWPFLEAGVSTVIDKKSGEVTDFIVHHEIEDADDSGFDPIRQLLQDELSRPGYSNGIALKLGATQQMPAVELLPEITLTVESLDDQQVGLSLQGENDEVKLYGVIQLERSTGWLTRSAVVMDMPLQHEFAEGRVRVVAAVMPDDWKSGFDLDFIYSADYQMPADIGALPDDLTALDMPSSAEVFPGRSGSIQSNGDKITLEYNHGVFDMFQLGHIEVDNLQAHDQAGNPIELDLHSVGALSFAFSETKAVQTHTDIYPLGWQDVVPKLEQIAFIEARLQRFAVTHNIVRLPVKDSETSVQFGEARAVLTPTEQPDVYHLRLEQAKNVFFSTRITGPDSGSVEHMKAANVPDWLEDGNRRLMAIVTSGYFPLSHTLYFEGERPNELQLLAHRIEDQSLEEKQIRFYNPDVALSTVELEPLTSVYLFPEEDNVTDFASTGPVFELKELHDLAPQDFERPQLYMVLSHEQAALCSLEQTADIKEAGRRIVWLPHEPRQRFMRRDSQLPLEVVYQLATEDGVRNFFYDHTAVVRLQCAGQPEWQLFDLDLGEQNWLVPVSALLGENWQEAFADMQLIELLRLFRFLDTQQKALSLVPPPGFASQPGVKLADIRLLDFVTEEGMLRIAGRVNRVEKLEASGDRIVREWVHQFPALPSSQVAYQD